MRKPIVCVCGVLALGCLASFDRPGARGQPPPAERADATEGQRFRGKLLFVTVKPAPKGRLLLEGSTIESLGGRSFLTGVQADMGQKGWNIGLRHWLPLDDVLMMMEFDSVAQYNERAAASAPPRQPAPKNDGDGGGTRDPGSL